VLRRVMQSRAPEPFLSEFAYPDGTQGRFELLIEPVADGLCVLSLDVSDSTLGEEQGRLNGAVLEGEPMLPRPSQASRTGEPRNLTRPRSVSRSLCGSETVLLVEQDEGVRELMRASLAQQGYTVLSAGDVWTAMAAAGAREAPVHLLITDVILPDMNGPRLAQHILAVHPRLRVLYVGGLPQGWVLGLSALRARVSFLPRPHGPSVLLGAVRDALDG
jgi:CheY-like chemotaxis protein